jgi:hypothetical protein
MRLGENMSETGKEEYVKYMNNPPINNYINDKLYLMRNVSNVLYDKDVNILSKPALIRQFMDSLPPRVATSDLKEEYGLVCGYEMNTGLIKYNQSLWNIWKKVCDWCYDNLFKQNFSQLQSGDFEKLEGEEEKQE